MTARFEKDYRKAERLSDEVFDEIPIAWASAVIAICVLVMSMELCIKYPPAPIWLDVICSAASIVAVSWMIVEWWRLGGAIEASREHHRKMRDSE